MLASNANGDGGFQLSALWVPRRAAAAATEAAAAAAAAQAAAAAASVAPVPVAGRVRMASVVLQGPVVLGQITASGAPGQRLDGVDVAAGDVVLLTAQADEPSVRIEAPSLEELHHEAREALIRQFGAAHSAFRVRIRRARPQPASHIRPLAPGGGCRR